MGCIRHKGYMDCIQHMGCKDYIHHMGCRGYTQQHKGYRRMGYKDCRQPPFSFWLRRDYTGYTRHNLSWLNTDCNWPVQ